MAPTGKAARRFGWDIQTENLTVTHMAVGMAALTLAERARGRPVARAQSARSRTEDKTAENEPRIINHGHPHELTLAGVKDLQAQLARQSLAAREMRERIEALSARATDADNRYTELEDELNVSRNEILLQQNDKHALETSLDRLTRENAQLTHRLGESEIAVKKSGSQIEQVQKALYAAQLSCKDLTGALDEARQKSQSESNSLKAAKLQRTKLTAALDRAQQRYRTESDNLKAMEIERHDLAAALHGAQQRYDIQHSKLIILGIEHDKLAVELTETNAKHLAEISQLKSRLDDTTSRAEVAEGILSKLRQILLQKFNMLQASLGIKDCEIHDLEQSRTKLVDGIKMLLGIFEMRDGALIRADQHIKFLTDRIAELEGELYLSKSRQKLKEIDDRAQSDAPVRERADPSLRIDTNGIRLSSNSDAYFMNTSNNSEPPRICVAEAMLTATITF